MIGGYDPPTELQAAAATAMFKEIIPRTAPPITLKGGGAYRDALSEELQKVYTKQQTPEQAAKSLQDRWDKITDDQGVEIQVAALETFIAAFPTVDSTRRRRRVPWRRLLTTEPKTAGRRRKAAPARLRRDVRQGTVSKLLVAPGQLLMAFIVIFPAIIAIYIGFTTWGPTSGVDFWHAYEYWHWFDGYWEALTHPRVLGGACGARC